MIATAEPLSRPAPMERRGFASAAQGGGARLPTSLQSLRIVRPRKHGYRTPPSVRYAGKPTCLANPFERRPRNDHSYMFGQARAWKLHRRWLQGGLGALTLERLGFSPGEIDALTRLRARVLRMLPRLRGCTIQCWCSLKSRWCHVDTIIELANPGDIQ